MVVKDGVIVPRYSHGEILDAVFRRTRVTVAIIDASNPYHYAEVRGRVVSRAVGQEAADHINALSHKYTGAPYAFGSTETRVIYRIEPVRQRPAN